MLEIKTPRESRDHGALSIYPLDDKLINAQDQQ